MSHPNVSFVEQAIDDISSTIVLLEHAAKDAINSRQETWDLLRISHLLRVVQIDLNMHLETAWWNYPEISH